MSTEPPRAAVPAGSEPPKTEAPAKSQAGARKAARLLLFRHGREPGARAPELRQHLGKDYEKHLETLQEHLADLGLEVRHHGEHEERRHYIALREPPASGELRTSGWRVDDLAALAATAAYLLSRQGRVTRKELEEVLRKKLPSQRVEFNLKRFLRQGYLEEDGGMLHLGWRSEAEIDFKALMALMGVRRE